MRMRILLTPVVVCCVGLLTLTVCFGKVQQALRLQANVVSEAIARDVATSPDPAAAAAASTVEAGHTVLVVQNGTLLASKPEWTQSLPPAGVSAEAQQNGIDRVSWQNAKGSRFALVAVRAPAGVTVLAFQSLEPIESVIAVVTRLWLLGSLLLLVTCIAWALIRSRQSA